MAEPAAKGGRGEHCESEHETDGPEKLLELRQLFDLYDVDASGFVDAKEILAALRGNYTAHQVGRTTVSVTSLCYVMLTSHTYLHVRNLGNILVCRWHIKPDSEIIRFPNGE